MKVAIILLATLGLIVAAANGSGFCVECDGFVSSRGADEGTCLGPDGCSHSSDSSCGSDMQGGASIDARSEHVGCRDALRGPDAAPPPEPESSKRSASRSDSDYLAAAGGFTDPVLSHSDRGDATRLSRGAPTPALLSSVVLLL